MKFPLTPPSVTPAHRSAPAPPYFFKSRSRSPDFRARPAPFSAPAPLTCCATVLLENTFVDFSINFQKCSPSRHRCNHGEMGATCSPNKNVQIFQLSSTEELRKFKKSPQILPLRGEDTHQTPPAIPPWSLHACRVSFIHDATNT